MKIVSWNVNGIKACLERGFLKFIADSKPDIVCCQEIKDSGTIQLNVPGYYQYWNFGNRPGYAGTLVLTRKEPLSCTLGMGIEEFDTEGRIITLEYKDFMVVNVYVPSVNTNSAPDRPDYRIEWDAAFLKYVAKLPKPAILAGDFNVAREAIDSYPRVDDEQQQIYSCTEAQEGFEMILSAGFVDAFRTLYPLKDGAYTWWGPKNKNRGENHGHRLDYFLVSKDLLTFVRNIKFHVDIVCSDHCPISMLFYPIAQETDMDDAALARLWQDTDMAEMEREVLSKQRAIAKAAYYRNWRAVKLLQDELVCSWAARAAAVEHVAESGSQGYMLVV